MGGVGRKRACVDPTAIDLTAKKVDKANILLVQPNTHKSCQVHICMQYIQYSIKKGLAAKPFVI